MAVPLGHLTQASFAVEVTPGTAVSPRTVGMRLVSNDLAPKLKSSPLKNLTGDGVVPISTGPLQESIEVGGNLKAQACYQGGALGLLLELAMGTSSCTTTGTGPYDHTFALTGTQDCVTIASERGNTAKDDVMNGCKLSKLVLSVQPGQAMEVSADFIGMGYDARAVVAKITPATPYYIKHNHCGQLGFDSANYVLSSLTLTIDRKVAPLMELGTLNSAEPQPTDMIEIMLEAELVVRDNVLQVAALAGTSANVTCSLTDGTRTLAITLHNGVIMSHSDPISSVGVIKQKVTWNAYGDGTNHGLAIVLTNANSSNRAS